MKKSAIAKLEKMLLNEKERLEKELDHFEAILLSKTIKEAGGDLSSCATHIADHASDTSENSKLFSLMERVRERLIWVEEALDTVNHGHFGICQMCLCPITLDRLMAKPHAKYCIKCRQQMDQGGR